MTDVILDVSHIAKTFGHVQALKNITLSLRKGRVHTLLGENGAGKSTLMKILAGVYPPTQGTITLRGETITINNPQHSRQLGIAIIFQELSLSNNMSVAENIYANNETRCVGNIYNKKPHFSVTKKYLRYILMHNCKKGKRKCKFFYAHPQYFQ